MDKPVRASKALRNRMEDLSKLLYAELAPPKHVMTRDAYTSINRATMMSRGAIGQVVTRNAIIQHIMMATWMP